MRAVESWRTGQPIGAEADPVELVSTFMRVVDAGWPPGRCDDPHLAERLGALPGLLVEHPDIAAVLDWWRCAALGEPATSRCYGTLSVVDEPWRSVMEQLRDQQPRLRGITPMAWCLARRSLDRLLLDLDANLDFQQGHFDLAAAGRAWNELVAEPRRFLAEVRAGGNPLRPHHADGDPERTLRAHGVPEHQPIWRRLVKQHQVVDGLLGKVAAVIDDAQQADARPMDPPVDRLRPPPPDRPAHRVVAVALRPLLVGPPPTADPTGAVERLALAGDDADRWWLAAALAQWHHATSATVPSLEPSWAQRRGLLDRLPRLRGRVADDELESIEARIAWADDPITVGADIDDLTARAERTDHEHRLRGRVNQLRARLGQLTDEGDDGDIEALGHTLELLEADLVDGVIAGLDERLDELVDDIGKLHPEPTVFGSFADLASLLPIPVAAPAAGADTRAPSGGSSSARSEDTTPAPLDDGRARLRRLLDSVIERRDARVGEPGHDELARVDELVRQSVESLAAGDLLAAHKTAVEASDLLDRRRCPRWAADDGERALVDHVVAYVQERVAFAEDDVRRLHVALKSRPFAIIAGLTGTGKSTLARLYAEALDIRADDGRFVRQAVRPNWIDETEVLGYVDPATGSFRPGWFAEVLRTCAAHPDLPVMCVLDEMNLAPVEHYLSDVLVALEEAASGDTAPVRLYTAGDQPTNGHVWPPAFPYPQNLLLVGTVNIDESTRALSDRVLDRANLLQLSSRVDRSHHELPAGDLRREPPWQVRMDGWRAIRHEVGDDRHHDFLEDVAAVLVGLRLGLGPRAHLAIERYCSNAAGVIDDTDALDQALLQRVIPKISGFRSALENGLRELRELVHGVGAERCARVIDDWLADDRSGDDYLDGTAASVGLAAESVGP